MNFGLRFEGGWRVNEAEGMEFCIGLAGKKKNVIFRDVFLREILSFFANVLYYFY